jgi:hypothetical protein
MPVPQQGGFSIGDAQTKAGANLRAVATVGPKESLANSDAVKRPTALAI